VDGVANAFVGTSGVRGFPTNIIHADTLDYDARGKIIDARTKQDSAGAAYSALGSLVYAYDASLAILNQAEFTVENYDVDALGNPHRTVHKSNVTSGIQQVSDSTAYHYEPTSARVTSRIGGTTLTSPTLATFADSTWYDPAGNRAGYLMGSNPMGQGLQEDTRDYYNADDQLRVVDRRTCADATGTQGTCVENREPGQDYRGAFETYRYDALGRRVLVRTLTDSACFYQLCPHTLERTVWDGSQVLYEIRYRGADASLATEPDTISYPDTIIGVLYHPYGRVAYTNGPTLDKPLDIIRMGFDVDSFANPIVLIPHTDWKGHFDIGSYDDGSMNRCTNYTDIRSCVTIYWPAPYLYAQHESSNNSITADAFRTWFGERLADMRDASGQIFMRNRYYDPGTGRFTQEDPIGLAGGMNLYGFAGGDPVNFSDPFGLCPVTKEDPTPCDNPSTAGAFGHYIRGSGTPLTRDFATINTEGVKASQFAAVKGRLSAGESGTFEVDGKMGFDTKDLVDGNITLRLQGSLTTQCDQGVCAYSFKGTLGAYDDPYDFNAAHRSKLGEFLTGVGRHTPGKDYMIQIKGKKDVIESGTSPP
jgi:RHS repeat-associated protein